MKSSIGIIFGFILLIIANLTLSEEPHKHVWHECEYGPCIMCETTKNIYYGTPKDNVKDKFKNGYRMPKGENANNSKLTNEDVKKIKKLLEEDLFLQKQIAEMFDVHETIIQRINTGKLWNHVKI